jgi:general secretion pathway protein G
MRKFCTDFPLLMKEGIRKRLGFTQPPLDLPLYKGVKPRMRTFFPHQRGLTFVEMMVVVVIILVLSSIVLPVAKFSVRRQREIELKRNLRMLRDAIDAYHEAAVPSTPGATPKIQTKFGTDGWPPTLEILVEGETMIGDVKGRKLRFLRRIPIDPITNSKDWALRSSQDDADAGMWGGENVWDVRCKAHVLSLDGVTYYDEW